MLSASDTSFIDNLSTRVITDFRNDVCHTKLLAVMWPTFFSMLNLTVDPIPDFYEGFH